MKGTIRSQRDFARRLAVTGWIAAVALGFILWRVLS